MRLLTFDTETTGTDVENDRIITCFVRVKDGTKVLASQNWVINPGVEVPDGASEVHGMTTQWVQENGRPDVAECLLEIITLIRGYAQQGFIIAGYNSSFDLSILDAEAKRHTNSGLELPKEVRYLDPIVIDRKIDKYRKGSRRLVDVAAHYGVTVDEEKAHAADYDVHLTEELIPKVLNKAWGVLRDERQELTPDEFISKLQVWQAEWKKEWAEGLTAYFKKAGKTEEDGSPIIVNGNFPW